MEEEEEKGKGKESSGDKKRKKEAEGNNVTRRYFPARMVPVTFQQPGTTCTK